MTDIPEVFQTVRISRTGTDQLILEVDATQLSVVEGPDAGKKISRCLPLIRVGTAEDNDFVLQDPSASRYHAEIQETAGEFSLRDLGSTNGTRIDGVRINEAPLELPARVSLGDTVLEIKRRTKRHRDQTLVGQANPEGLIGSSPPMLELFSLLRAVAPTDVPVLLEGESGTGKELVARALHAGSGRKGPLVVFDCATADPEMIRADLLGHKKGAFTGAAEARPGAARAANGGTLFLDEIGELPLEIQPRLLRLLERREVIPVGSDHAESVDVRVVTASHRNLAQMVREGTFREDLFHRMAVVPVMVPPLRVRPGDIPELIDHLLKERGLQIDFSPEARAAMAAYSWPGNVRQLRNVLERTAILCRGRTVHPTDLKLDHAAPIIAAETAAVSTVEAGPSGSTGPVCGKTIHDVEREMIIEALQRHSGDKTAAAAAVGISIGTLRRRLKSYNLDDK